MKETIEQLIQDALKPSFLAVIDESHMHNVPPGAQSHFKLIVVSDAFDNLALVARHRQINQLLGRLFTQGLHALALHTMTPTEWEAKAQQYPESPQCMGGGKTS